MVLLAMFIFFPLSLYSTILPGDFSILAFCFSRHLSPHVHVSSYRMILVLLPGAAAILWAVGVIEVG
jgi:hypothetical protein